jgi:hypothetical protein
MLKAAVIVFLITCAVCAVVSKRAQTVLAPVVLIGALITAILIDHALHIASGWDCWAWQHPPHCSLIP